MLHFTVNNRRERQQLEHAGGVIEFGRGARRDAPRCMIADPYVSKDHVRVEELANGLVRVENLSQRGPVALPGNQALPPGQRRDLTLPCRLGIGDTTIDIDVPQADGVERDLLQTVTMPAMPRLRGDCRATILNLGAMPESATPETMTSWVEAAIAVLQAAPGSPEFYQQAAQAMVDLIGLDRGLVLLREGEGWQVVARAFKGEGGIGREYSQTILRYVVEEQRTFFQTAGRMATQAESLHGVQAVVAAPLFSEQGQVTGAIYGSRRWNPRDHDITALEAQMVQLLSTVVGVGLLRVEQAAEETRLRVAKAAAEEADRTKGQFLATVSHELRTPLNAIIGYSEMLQELAQDDGQEKYIPDLKKIHWAGQHLLALINDILDLSKIEAGRIELYLENFPVTVIVQEVTATVQTLIAKNGNVLEVRGAEQAGTIHADATRVRQCLLNLLSNAAKFTERGRITLAASRAVEGDRDWIYFRVTDTGIGMTEEQMGRLFQAFSQADASTTRKYGGTGLGLAISQRFCQMMGGEITVQS
ncbi:MAG: GAF domain-containing protein, partial [Planctomycetia bacterium]|nr:GAF domain-containing protein [Planctomycetia bacterium]